VSEKLAEVRRILDRYLIEVVEGFELCPWAYTARTSDEVGIEVLWGEPTPAMWADAGERLLANPKTRVAMIVAPESAATSADLRAMRDHVGTRVRIAGIAHFHPDAALDLASPPRLVPFLRRSPDPLLQLVPLALLESVRGASTVVVDIAQQAQMLKGELPPLRADVADRIAETNHERVSKDAAAVTALLEDIARDRRESYARVGIRSSR
jgi:hypothetical protein